MLGPAEDFPVGSIEWAERMSNRLQLDVRSLSRSASHSLRKTIEAITRAKPWESWPKGRPYGTADRYSRAVTGHRWEDLLWIIGELIGAPGPDMRVLRAKLSMARENVDAFCRIVSASGIDIEQEDDDSPISKEWLRLHDQERRLVDQLRQALGPEPDELGMVRPEKRTRPGWGRALSICL
jgi:hypothetical protein